MISFNRKISHDLLQFLEILASAQSSKQKSPEETGKDLTRKFQEVMEQLNEPVLNSKKLCHKLANVILLEEDKKNIYELFYKILFGKAFPPDLIENIQRRVIEDLPPDQQLAITRLVVLIFKNIPFESKRNILGELVIISHGQRIDVIRQFAPYVKDIDNGHVRSFMISRLAKIRQSQREDFIKCTMQLIHGIQAGTQITIIHILSSLFVEHCADFFKVLPLIKKAARWEEERIELLSILVKIPNDHWEAALNVTISILKELKTHPSEMLMTVGIFHEDLYNGAALEPLLQIFFGKFEQEQRSDCLEVLRLIAPDQRLKALGIICHNAELLRGDLITHLFSLDESIMASTYEYLLDTLHNDIENAESSFKLSSWIIEHRDSLLLKSDHPLLIEAIAVKDISDPSAKKEKLNPYRLFAELKQGYGPWINFRPESVRIDGKEIAFDVEAIRKKTRRGYTVADLPVTVKPNTLKTLFHKLIKRIDKLPKAKRHETKHYIKKSFGRSLKRLTSNMLDKSFMKKLTNVRGKSNDPVQNTVFYFYSILNALLDQSNALIASDLLSPQEEMLLSMSTSIANCPIGQQEGIDDYYIKLPEKYRRLDKPMEETSEEKVNYILDRSFQILLKEAFNNETMIRELIYDKLKKEMFPKNNDLTSDELTLLNKEYQKQLRVVAGQLYHQILFLKNRFYWYVGLHHSLAFDPHSYVINLYLHGVPLNMFLKTLYKYLTPQMALTRLKKDLDNELKTSKCIFSTSAGNCLKSIYPDYDDTLKEAMTKDVPKGGLVTKYLVLNEEYVPVEFTDKAVLGLLLHSGYFEDLSH